MLRVLLFVVVAFFVTALAEEPAAQYDVVLVDTRVDAWTKEIKLRLQAGAEDTPCTLTNVTVSSAASGFSAVFYPSTQPSACQEDVTATSENEIPPGVYTVTVAGTKKGASALSQETPMTLTATATISAQASGLVSGSANDVKIGKGPGEAAAFTLLVRDVNGNNISSEWPLTEALVCGTSGAEGMVVATAVEGAFEGNLVCNFTLRLDETSAPLGERTNMTVNAMVSGTVSDAMNVWAGPTPMTGTITLNSTEAERAQVGTCVSGRVVVTDDTSRAVLPPYPLELHVEDGGAGGSTTEAISTAESMFSWCPTKAGRHTVRAWVARADAGNEMLQHIGTWSVNVTSGVANASTSWVEVENNVAGRVRVRAALRDAWNNTVAGNSPEASLFTLNVMLVRSSTENHTAVLNAINSFEASLDTVTRSGEYTLRVTTKDGVTKAPLRVHVFPAPLLAANCVLNSSMLGDLFSIEVAKPYTVKVRLYDEFGNERVECNDTAAINATLLRHTSVLQSALITRDNQTTATYTVHFSPPDQGNIVLSVKVASEKVPDSPVMLLVSSVRVRPLFQTSLSVSSAPGVLYIDPINAWVPQTLFNNTEVNVRVMKVNGNDSSLVSSGAAVRWKSGYVASLPATNVGQFRVFVQATSKDSHMHHMNAVPGSPVTYDVVSGMVDPQTSKVQVGTADTLVVTAGQDVTLPMELLDNKGKPAVLGVNLVQVHVASYDYLSQTPPGLEATVTETTPGLGTLNLRVTVANLYEVRVGTAQGQVQGAPFMLSVLPDALNPAHCTVDGYPFGDVLTKDTLSIEVTPRDQFGNKRDDVNSPTLQDFQMTLKGRRALPGDTHASGASVSPDVVNKGSVNGLWQFQMRPRVNGVYSVEVVAWMKQSGGQTSSQAVTIQGSPFEVTVRDAGPAIVAFEALPGTRMEDGGSQFAQGVQMRISFDKATNQVEVGSKAALDALLVFSTPISGYANYRGEWASDQVLVVSVTEMQVGVSADALPAIGHLKVSVLPSGGLRDALNISMASSSSSDTIYGSWASSKPNNASDWTWEYVLVAMVPLGVAGMLFWLRRRRQLQQPYSRLKQAPWESSRRGQDMEMQDLMGSRHGDANDDEDDDGDDGGFAALSRFSDAEAGAFVGQNTAKTAATTTSSNGAAKAQPMFTIVDHGDSSDDDLEDFDDDEFANLTGGMKL